MTNNEFNRHVQRMVDKSLETLCEKGEEYAIGDDRLSHFRATAAVLGCTPAQAAFAMSAKHIVSIADMIRYNAVDDYPEVWDEKIGDLINYLLIIRALIAEEQERLHDWSNANTFTCSRCDRTYSKRPQECQIEIDEKTHQGYVVAECPECDQTNVAETTETEL